MLARIFMKGGFGCQDGITARITPPVRMSCFLMTAAAPFTGRNASAVLSPAITAHVQPATERIIKELLNDKRFSHLLITVAHPPLGKDYSDTLQAIVQINARKSRSDRRKEAVNFI